MSSDSQAGVILSPTGHLAMPGDIIGDNIFGCHNWEGLAAGIL